MRRAVLIGFLILLAIDTTSNVLIKIASNRTGPPFEGAGWLGRFISEPLILAIIGCYIAAFLAYTSLLKHAPVGPAFAAVHGHVVTVLIVSLAWFGERLTGLQVAGCLLIVAGIIVLALTEPLEAPPEPLPEAGPGPQPPAGAG